MSKKLDALAHHSLEEAFGQHAPEVLDSGWIPRLQLQQVVATPVDRRGYHPSFAPDGQRDTGSAAPAYEYLLQ